MSASGWTENKIEGTRHGVGTAVVQVRGRKSVVLITFDSVCDPLALLTTAFHGLTMPAALYVVETTFSGKVESHSLRHVIQINKLLRILNPLSGPLSSLE